MKMRQESARVGLLWVLSLILLLITLFGSAGSLKIASFNVQIFGQNKMKNPATVETLVKIVRRYDVILIQEIRDRTGTAIHQLLDKVNEDGSHEYDIKVSERLGRSTSKEQYAYLYRSSLTWEQDFQYPESYDQFERPPFCIKFQSKKAAVSEFALVGLHSKPKRGETIREINNLGLVHSVVTKNMSTDNILMMGDLNAGCDYVSQAELSDSPLRTDANYHWLISDKIDTTVSGSECAYDRFIMSGNKFVSALMPNSAKVFRFDEAYSLTLAQAKAVSDHYPIELEICPSSCWRKRRDTEQGACPIHCYSSEGVSVCGWLHYFVLSYCMITWLMNIQL